MAINIFVPTLQPKEPVTSGQFNSGFGFLLGNFREDGGFEEF